jgi:hypothetical protein
MRTTVTSTSPLSRHTAARPLFWFVSPPRSAPAGPVVGGGDEGGGGDASGTRRRPGDGAIAGYSGFVSRHAGAAGGNGIDAETAKGRFARGAPPSTVLDDGFVGTSISPADMFAKKIEAKVCTAWACPKPRTARAKHTSSPPATTRNRSVRRQPTSAEWVGVTTAKLKAHRARVCTCFWRCSTREWMGGHHRKAETTPCACARAFCVLV